MALVCQCGELAPLPFCDGPCAPSPRLRSTTLRQVLALCSQILHLRTSTGLINLGASGRLLNFRLDVTRPLPMVALACKSSSGPLGGCCITLRRALVGLGRAGGGRVRRALRVTRARRVGAWARCSPHCAGISLHRVVGAVRGRRGTQRWGAWRPHVGGQGHGVVTIVPFRNSEFYRPFRRVLYVRIYSYRERTQTTCNFLNS